MPQTPPDPAQLSLKLLKALFGELPQAFNVRLWDGSVWPDAYPRPATLVLNHPGALRAMFSEGDEVGLGEGYLYDDCDILGNVEAIYGEIERLLFNPPGPAKKLLLWRMLRQLPDESRRRAALEDHAMQARGRARVSGQRHSVKRDKSAVTYHYDVSNDFYALWQDPHMVYSCAYFESPEEDLNPAQERKLDYLCRKLRLKPGQKLLDLGCGWGGLVMLAAQRYGVDATGITLSQPQADLANERIAKAGLAKRCRVLVRDYRDMRANATWDVLVSVGMFEHVGEKKLPGYFKQARNLLKPGGVFMNHGIALRGTDTWRRGPTFTNTYVFPDGELVPIHVTLTAAEQAGFEVRDVESLREHYALTLRHWVRRLEAHHAEALQCVSEPTYRVWRLYMSGSAHGFTTGRLNLYQTLMVKPTAAGPSGLPLQRGDWYG